MDDFEDPRDTELSSLSAIFPEIRRVHPDDPYTVALDVPVNPSKSVVVRFPTPIDAPVAPEGASAAQVAANGTPVNRPVVDTHELAHLPPVQLQLVLGPGYPTSGPPQVTVSTSPPWLPAEVTKKLEDDGPRLWEDMGRDIVAFTYIDHIQQLADDIFGLADNDQAGLEVDPQHKVAILDYDIRARRAAFEKETFDCGICLDPKKGSACHRMLDCGHVFCVGCLQDFYNSAIKEGDVASVRCLSPNCARDREQKAAASKKRKKAKTTISPSELLQIPLDQEAVKRYVSLKYKNELESDKNTIYCPRSWCGGAARSKRRRKPTSLELDSRASDGSVSEEDNDDDADGLADGDGEGAGELKSKPYKPLKDLLAVCEDCGFAFCRRCYASWHGEFVRCTPKRDEEELTAEEQASLEYLRLHTSPCPTCDAPAQKTHGCNHMICYRCQSHFCYLCSAWLDPGNPYQHFNEMPGGKRTACYMRLWELEDGDGAEVDYGFAGGFVQRQVAAVLPPPAAELVPEIEEAEDDEETEAARRAAQEERRRQNAQQGGGQVAFAREGPLVLRIAGNGPAEPERGGRRGQGDRAAAPARGRRQGNTNLVRGQRNQLRDQAVARGGRGGRGARIVGNGGRGAVARRQHNNNNNNNEGAVGQQEARNHRRGRNGAAPERLVQAQAIHDDGGQNGAGDLDAAQQAWVRRFVQLALNDEEDILLESDSDSSNDLF